jgi:hypothetical protein
MNTRKTERGATQFLIRSVVWVPSALMPPVTMAPGLTVRAAPFALLSHDREGVVVTL